MTPIFRIVADGADITALINDRLLLRRTTDKPGHQKVMCPRNDVKWSAD
ncbi:hypothetical protein [Pseudomonas weihenstephanensis]|nr:hypothetical protein [Pseudomonas weihenstephanensis]